MAKPVRPTIPPFWLDDVGPVRTLDALPAAYLDAIRAAGMEPERHRFNELPRFGRGYAGPTLREWLTSRGALTTEVSDG